MNRLDLFFNRLDLISVFIESLFTLGVVFTFIEPLFTLANFAQEIVDTEKNIRMGQGLETNRCSMISNA